MVRIRLPPAVSQQTLRASAMLITSAASSGSWHRSGSTLASSLRQAFRPIAGRRTRSAGARRWAQATFLLHSRFEAMSAPARNVASLAHTTSSVTPFPADEGAEAAVDASDHALAVTHRGHHCLYALRNDLGMFDDVALRIDHAGDQDKFVGQLVLSQRGRFVLTPRISEFKSERAHVGLVECRQDDF